MKLNFGEIKKFFIDATSFLKNVANDPRIPKRDKGTLLVLLGLLVSPLDLIPDWIPFFGQIDDVIVLALIFDYFFSVLDEQILLDHYPFGATSFKYLKFISKIVSNLAPSMVKKRLWAYAEKASSFSSTKP